ncbi:MAG TPA: RimK/LysX family protein [Patescibacteria group bacterium]|nr:RimK/LysX family protein [Patescibacteria group bacterium]
MMKLLKEFVFTNAPESMKSKKSKITIGRKDKVDFPELDLMEIDAKIDTGAYTGALHCRDIRVYDEEGHEMVYFTLMDQLDPLYDGCRFSLPVASRRVIRNSFGRAEERIIIATTIVLFEKTMPIELSLSDRSEMKYPVLLGRKLLMEGFVVDVSKTNLSFKKKVKKRSVA